VGRSLRTAAKTATAGSTSRASTPVPASLAYSVHDGGVDGAWSGLRMVGIGGRVPVASTGLHLGLGFRYSKGSSPRLGQSLALSRVRATTVPFPSMHPFHLSAMAGLPAITLFEGTGGSAWVCGIEVHQVHLTTPQSFSPSGAVGSHASDSPYFCHSSKAWL
jgi:hypothetical protein